MKFNILTTTLLTQSDMDVLDLPGDIWFEIRRHLNSISLHALRSTCWYLIRERSLFHLKKPQESEAFMENIYYTRCYYDWIHTVVKFSGFKELPIVYYLGWKKAFVILNDIDVLGLIPESVLLANHWLYGSLDNWQIYTKYMTKQGIKQYFTEVFIYYPYKFAIEQLWYAKHEMIMDLGNFGDNESTPLSNRNNFIRGTLGKHMKKVTNCPCFYRDIYKLCFYRARQYRRNGSKYSY